MFDISWGEMGVIIGVTTFFIGKHDLPKAARYAGTYVGRFVGFVQGARARADRFAANHELKQLQNELRSGLRELDVVKSELATSLSSRGMMGRTLGSTVSGVNRTDNNTNSNALPQVPLSLPSAPSPLLSTQFTPSTTPQIASSLSLPPQRQTMGAVAEEEWKRQGIDFVSRAERGTNSRLNVEKSGSATLAFLLKESLLFSQYDRMVQEQEQALQKRMTAMEEQLQAHPDSTKDEKDKEW
ncbi:hypothetical protein FisN_7Hh014 [Fistulifera solaris]|uniref:Sec-independent protein translocase protein TatB n=1 Tax=Fistulifera solaris TaxID=1519565 RepID=A0A1Z5K396_FISSO|nr:hypothetical protein FisN_7Hh014 [Fistulifera solaris]|eukprot:GAX20705.1 hypothetical protein FisN_7Hh014 [Fistulifera solaris]